MENSSWESRENRGGCGGGGGGGGHMRMMEEEKVDGNHAYKFEGSLIALRSDSL
jgi:hypothetical protein